MDSCISFYRKNKEHLVIASNLAREQRILRIRLPQGISAAQNAEDHSEIKIEDGFISLIIPRNDYRAIRLF